MAKVLLSGRDEGAAVAAASGQWVYVHPSHVVGTFCRQTQLAKGGSFLQNEPPLSGEIKLVSNSQNGSLLQSEPFLIGVNGRLPPPPLSSLTKSSSNHTLLVETMLIRFDDYLPQWNYVAVPTNYKLPYVI